MCDRVTPSKLFVVYAIRKRGSASAGKVKAVKSYPTPRSPKEVRAFLGLASFYRRLVPNFAEAAKPDEINTEKPRDHMGTESARTI